MPGEIERTHNHEEQQPVTDHANNNTSPSFTHYEITFPFGSSPFFSISPQYTSPQRIGTAPTTRSIPLPSTIRPIP